MFALRPTLFLTVSALVAGAAPLLHASAELEARFLSEVRPILERTCYECHTPETKKGKIEFSTLTTIADFAERGTLLDGIIGVVEEHEMPPKKHPHQPTDEEREVIVLWMEKALAAARSALPNDPARVVMPRLNEREYNNVVRDLTGLPIDAASSFPRDGGGGEGFKNVGEAQSMTSMQVEKYLRAGRWIVDHAHILHTGELLWYGTPLRPKANEKQFDVLVERWVALHKVITQRVYGKRDALVKQNHGSPVVPYWQAAWRYHHRAALGVPNATFESLSAEGPGVLDPRMLRNWYSLFTTTTPQPRYIQEIITRWRALPAPAAGGTFANIKPALEALENFGWDRHQTEPDGMNRQRVPNYEVLAPNGDNAARKRFAADLTERGRYVARVDLTKLPRDAKSLHLGLGSADDGTAGDVVVYRKLAFLGKDGREVPFRTAVPAAAWETGTPVWSGDSFKVSGPFLVSFAPPASATALLIEAELDPAEGRDGTVQPFITHTKPVDLSFIPRRSIMAFKENPRAKAFRDDIRAVRLAIATNFFYSPGNLFADYPGVDPRWAPKGVSTETYKPDQRLVRPHLLTLAEVRADCTPAEAAELAALAKGMAASRGRDEPLKLADADLQRVITDFAARAWRRPLTADDRTSLGQLYRASLSTAGTQEDALRQTLSAVLVSPYFLYRVQYARGSDQPYELNGIELANRLSFFLWASKPDDELLRLGTSGELLKPDVLKAQARRLAHDPRAKALTTEFAASWLHFEGFDTFTAPDAQRFKEFTPALRLAMYEETTLFFEDLFRENRPLLNVLNADYTFLNGPLAKHYGIAGVEGPNMRRVQLPAGSPRGGVIGMGSILTRTSKPLRTSPVLRGDWVLVNLLGTPTPPPPDDVPLLSDDETSSDGLTLAQQLAKHRDHASCRACHEKLDPLGFTLENFDPIGRWRDNLNDGSVVDNKGVMPDGKTLDGIAGLRTYLNANRDLVIANFNKKLTGYALGRAVRITDKPLLDAMKKALEADDHRVQAAIDVLVTSPQFRTRRDVPTPAATTASLN